jgi:hypothetical protein
MLKAIKRFHFPELKSFALEILAAQTIPVITSYYKSHGLAITYPELVRHFFFLAKNDLGEPIRIPGSHSPAIVLDTFQTAEFAKWFDAIKNHLDQTLALPEMRQITKWRELFGDSFPATL